MAARSSPPTLIDRSLASGAARGRGRRRHQLRAWYPGLELPCPIRQTRVASRASMGGCRRRSLAYRREPAWYPVSELAQKAGMEASIRGNGSVARDPAIRGEAVIGPLARSHQPPASLAGPPRWPWSRLADRHARRREVPGGALPGLPAGDPLHADPSPRVDQPGDRVDGDPHVAAPAGSRASSATTATCCRSCRWRRARGGCKNVDLVVSLSHCVAKAVQPPPGVPHVCYCFTPMRYAWQCRDAYLEGWSDRPVRRALARTAARPAARLGPATAGRVTHFVAITETIRERIADCYGRDSRVIYPPVDTDFYTPARTDAARGLLPRRLGARPVQADRPGGGGLHAGWAAGWSSSARGRSGRGWRRSPARRSSSSAGSPTR